MIFFLQHKVENTYIYKYYLKTHVKQRIRFADIINKKRMLTEAKKEESRKKYANSK